MNAKVGANTASKVRQLLGAAAIAAALLVGNAASAEPHGGGGGFHGGFSSGGGFHGGGGSHFAPRAGVALRPGGAYGYRGSAGYGGYGWHGGYASGWHGGYGYGYGYGFHPWGGGYWGGGWWPGAYYGWGYPLFLATLPALYSTYWWDGVPYYYTNNVYYTWNTGQNGYVVTDPPMVAAGDDQAEATAAPDGTVSTPPSAAATGARQSAGIIAYPRNGQSDQQTATDKYECHVWAKGQTGFDPTSQSSSGASPSVRSAYNRAISACLDGRGYTVR